MPQAGLGHRHAARGAIEQAHPEALLQLPHRMAERRWCNPELRRRGQAVGNGDERRQAGQVAAIHRCIPLNIECKPACSFAAFVNILSIAETASPRFRKSRTFLNA
jgi:hypothetical protein